MFVEHPITGLIFYRFFNFDFANHRYPSWFVPADGDSVCIKKHTQTDMEFLYVESGVFRLEVNGVSYDAGEGDLVIINPGDPHSGVVNAGQKRAAYHCIKIGTDVLLNRICEGLNGYAAWLAGEKMKMVNFLPRAELERTGVQAHLQGFLQSVGKRDALSDIASVGNICLIFSVLFRPAYLQRTPILLSGEQKKKQFEQRIMAYLDQNWNLPITSRDAAKALSYSQEYFCKTFKEAMGETFSNYLVMLKIHKAMELIQTGTTPGDAMNAVGMNNYSYFYRSFRRIYGISPNKCRKKHN